MYACIHLEQLGRKFGFQKGFGVFKELLTCWGLKGVGVQLID